MSNWETALASAGVVLLSVVVGAVLSYFFQRRGMIEEHRFREEVASHSALRDIQGELEADIAVAENASREGTGPLRLSADMWHAHIGQTLRVPSHLQQSLRRAYFFVEQANFLFDQYARHPLQDNGEIGGYRLMCNSLVQEGGGVVAELTQYLEGDSATIGLHGRG